MAHNINTYIGRQSAWHKLGTVTGTYSTWDEIQAHGGFDFEPVKKQLSLDGALVNAWGVVRSDTGVFLGAVGSDYTGVPHASGFRMVDHVLGDINGAHYETAGVLGAGEVVWGLADLNRSITVGGNDETKLYLLFATSHDASMSWTMRLTGTRVVCQNTLNVALSGKASAIFRVRHTKNAQDKIARAHEVLAEVANESKTIEQKLNLLAGRRMTREAMLSVLDRLFPVKQKDANGKPLESARRANTVADVLKLYELNDANVFPEQRGTAVNLLNAVVEYTDHMRSSQNRAQSAMFGSGDALKTKALEVLLETADGLDVVTRSQVFTPGVPAMGGMLGSALDSTLFN